MNVIDIVLLVIFAASFVLATVKGMFHTIFDVLGKAITVLLTHHVVKTYSEDIFKVFIKKKVVAKSYDILSVLNDSTITQKAESFTTKFQGIMQLIGIDKTEFWKKVEENGLTGEKLVDSLIKNIITPVAASLSKAIITLVVFVALCLVFALISKAIAGALNGVPLLRGADIALGGLFGALRGVLFVGIAIYLLLYIALLVKSGSFVSTVEKSFIINTAKDYFSIFSDLTVKGSI